MIDILKTVTPSAEQWEIVVEGARNSFNSWNKSDSHRLYKEDSIKFIIGKNDMELLKKLAKGRGSDSKFRRMLPVWMTINAPLYWWKEFDTYKVGTVSNSCSTMHKIAAKKFEMADFSTEHLKLYDGVEWANETAPIMGMEQVIKLLNECRKRYLKTESKVDWWQMIQLLPSSYNQRRTVMLNYEVLAKIFAERRNHKLDEWIAFCDFVKGTIPYAKELIVGE